MKTMQSAIGTYSYYLLLKYWEHFTFPCVVGTVWLKKHLPGANVRMASRQTDACLLSFRRHAFRGLVVIWDPLTPAPTFHHIPLKSQRELTRMQPAFEICFSIWRIELVVCVFRSSEDKLKKYGSLGAFQMLPPCPLSTVANNGLCNNGGKCDQWVRGLRTCCNATLAQHETPDRVVGPQTSCSFPLPLHLSSGRHPGHH